MLISKNYFLHRSAQEAYKGFVRAYASHKEKKLFDIEKLDLKGVAKSFGFSVPPFVDLSILVCAIDKRTLVLVHLVTIMMGSMKIRVESTTLHFALDLYIQVVWNNRQNRNHRNGLITVRLYERTVQLLV